MAKFICIVVDIKTKSDLKEYEFTARDKWDAELQAKVIYGVAAHYTPRLPPVDGVIFDLVEV